MTLSHALDRRALLAAAASGLAAGPLPARTLPPYARAFGMIETEIGGRLGVAALDTGSGAWLRHRADERFAMCSTFKVLAAAHALALSDAGRLGLAERIAYSKADLLPHAPRTEARLAEGAMDVADLCAAAVEVSDNTAANLLLRRTGGPAGLTSWLRAIGDPVTRLDRTEPELNTNLPGDPRDTTTPEAFVRVLRIILLGPVLSEDSRARLTGWMIACETGGNRLRAGLPSAWRAGDKTGTGDHGAVNDVAIVWPPGRAPILIAVLLSGSARPAAALEAAHAKVARTVVAALA